MLSAKEAAKLTKREQKVQEAKIKQAKKSIEKALAQLNHDLAKLDFNEIPAKTLFYKDVQSCNQFVASRIKHAAKYDYTRSVIIPLDEISEHLVMPGKTFRTLARASKQFHKKLDQVALDIEQITDSEAAGDAYIAEAVKQWWKIVGNFVLWQYQTAGYAAAIKSDPILELNGASDKLILWW